MASRLSGYASEVQRDINSAFGSSVTPCASRRNPLDLSVRSVLGNTSSQSAMGRDSTQFVTIDERQYLMEVNIGQRMKECRCSSFISGEEKLLKMYREQKDRLLNS